MLVCTIRWLLYIMTPYNNIYCTLVDLVGILGVYIGVSVGVMGQLPSEEGFWCHGVRMF